MAALRAILFLLCASSSFAMPLDYWAMRSRMLVDEQEQAIGGTMSFTTNERIANEILMAAKYAEIDEAFHSPEKFLPSRNFLDVHSEVEQSEVFKIIRKMPKGAVLHSHDTAMASNDYIFKNVTYRENLYVCEVNGLLQLHFFETPDQRCDWQLLSKLRENPTQAEEVNARLKAQFTMVVQDPQRAYPDVNSAWKKFMSIFATITPMLIYRPVYADHYYHSLQQLYDDNIMYLEMRTTLPTLYELDGSTLTPLQSVDLYKEVTERFMKDHPDFIGTKLIYAPSRSASDKTMDNYLKILRQLKEAHPDFVAGFDLVGQEDKGKPLTSFVDKLMRFRPKVDFFFHAGETDWNGLSTDNNLIDAILLDTKRIGHGYAAMKHPMVLSTLRQRDIAIEVNPISNQVLALVSDLRNHPASILFAENYPVVVSNDDPGFWGASGLSYDFYEAFMGMMSRSADLRALKKLAMNSISYSSLSDQEKMDAMALFDQKWEEFVNSLAVPNSVTN